MTRWTDDSSALFHDPQAVAGYADKARRLVPGWADLQSMAALLVAERAPEQASVLVIGAGGGVELSAFARAPMRSGASSVSIRRKKCFGWP